MTGRHHPHFRSGKVRAVAAMLILLLVSCGSADDAVRAGAKSVDELAGVLDTTADDAAKLLDDAGRLGVTDDAFVTAVRNVDTVAIARPTSSLDDFSRKMGDDILVPAMCDLLADAVADGEPPSLGQMGIALVNAAIARLGNIPTIITTVEGVASDLESFYATAPSRLGAYARALVLKYQYC